MNDKKTEKAVYKFYWDCGRMGKLNGIFVADKQSVDDAIGKELYFGEVLGKHSEIYGPLERGDLTMLTDDSGFIEKFEKFGLSNGFNPLNYTPEAMG